MTDLVLFSELTTNDNKLIGQVTLNSARTLNAINQDMIDAIYGKLVQWQNNPDITCIFMDAVEGKAFCAGGDVRSLSQALSSGDDQVAAAFFEKEYRLDYLIHTYPKPVICWGNGIVMGGGLGLMAGADFRIVTDTSVLAMPEISIGLYPDVGGSWLLGHMPKGIGLFLALTGCRLNPADAMYLELANRFIDHAFHDNVLESLQQAQWQNEDAYAVAYQVIEQYTENSAGWLPYSKIREHRDLIIKMMGRPSLPEIMAELEQLEVDCEWLQAARKTAFSGSPLSAAISYRQLHEARHMSLKDVFRRELVLSVNTVLKGDFCEGVRALLVDKDKQPVWRFPSVNDIEPEELDVLFTPPWKPTDHPLNDL